MKKRVFLISLVLIIMSGFMSFATSNEDSDIQAILNKEKERVSSSQKTTNNDDNWKEDDKGNDKDNWIRPTEDETQAIEETTEEIVETESKENKRQVLSKVEIEKTNTTDNVDEYGNVIENDKDSWVGEDSGLQDTDIEMIDLSNIDKENSGVINITIDDGLELGKSNLKIVLVDSAYNLLNLYIYYRNDYKEKLNLPIGRYKINQVVNMNSLEQDLYVNEQDFIISKDTDVNLVIKQRVKETITETKEEVKETISAVDENKTKKANLVLTIIKIIVLLGILVGLGFGVKKFIEIKRGY